MFSAVRTALLARITGEPFNVVAERLPNGLRSSARDRRSGGEAQQSIGNLVWPSNKNDVLQQVPVFPFDVTGLDFKTMPCVSVAVNAYKPRKLNRLQYDDLVYPVPGTQATISFPDGESVTGHTLLERVPYPVPVQVSFSIRVFASSDVELIQIVDRLHDILDYRVGLAVTLKSGEATSLDAEIDDTLDPIAVPTALLQSPDMREYSQVITYTVEAYRDTSDQRTRVRTITRRDIAFEDYLTEEVTDILEEPGTREG